MKDQINTIREALALMPATHTTDIALTALDQIEKMVGKQEPVAWGMQHTDGAILDVISPEEHAREEGGYVVPLYRAAPVAQQYEAGDMASAAAQGFREGVASVTQQEPVAWLVCSVNSDGSLSLEHATAWEEAAHEHINDAITEHGIEEAASWVVRPAYVAAPVAQQYEAGDVASAAAQGFRDGVASMTQQEPVAWVHEDDPHRVISAATKVGAEKDGGAIASTTKPYSIPAFAAPVAQPSQAEVGNSGFDHKTAADFLSGKTVSDEAVRKFVQASRWAHDDRASLQSTLLSVRNELASREAEIALLKKELMAADAPPQQAEAVPSDVVRDAERLDWLLMQVSGKEFRRIGVEYSGNCKRSDIDAAIAQQKGQP